MKETWVIAAKKADFRGIADRLGVDPVLVRIMVNRGLQTPEEMEEYLRGGRESLHDPHLLKDVDTAARILGEKIRAKAPIRVIGDYDVDGIMSTYILDRALRRLGASVDTVIPDRVADGYGLNEHLVTQAADAGIDTILTCDNGIAAVSQIALAKERGMTVIVTDHHEVPEALPPADAIVNPKQRDCPYPYKGLCGAAVAWKLVQVLYEQAGVPADEADAWIEYVGFATVADVMDLAGENRTLVRLALAMLRETQNLGMRALIREKGVAPERISAYHIGYVLGPCLNASGRLETAQRSLALLLSETEEEAARQARELVELNEERKRMTEDAVEEAQALVEREEYDRDRVMLVFLPNCHESLAGLVAGRLRETYYRPVFVVTRGEDGCKGSGRSIEAYSMYEEMCRCADLFTQFGGHPMAAGFSLPEEHIDPLRTRLNEQTTLTEEDLIPKVTIDVPMPIGYITMDLIRQLEMLEPCGKGNRKPIFADRRPLEIVQCRVVGERRSVVRMRLADPDGRQVDAVYFGGVDDLRLSLGEKYDIVTADDTVAGRCTHHASLYFTYEPRVDEYFREPRIELRITGFRA